MDTCSMPTTAGHLEDAPCCTHVTDSKSMTQRVLHHVDPQVQLTPIKTAQVRNASDAGGAHSGHSDVTHLMPASATGPRADAHAASLLAQQRQPASPDSVVTAPKEQSAQTATPASAAKINVLEISPLPPPDPSEGPEAAAEYELYLQRWDEGDTLAQRWHRLAQSGRLEDVRADWEDWQLDVMLQQVKTRARAAQVQHDQSGATTPTSLASTRLRRGRGDVDDGTDSQAEEPRRVRSRRAPSTLQDYHVGRASGRTPDRLEAGAAGAAAANHTTIPSQPMHPDPAADGSDEFLDEGTAQEYTVNAAQQLQQQQQQVWPGGLRIPAGQPAGLRRPTSRLQHAAPPALQLPPSNMGTDCGSPAHAQQAHMHMQAQQQQMQLMQQVMLQLAPGQASLQVSPEMQERWFKIGAVLGSMMNQQGGPASLMTNPAAMSALVESVLQETTGDPEAAMQQLAASLALPQSCMGQM